MLSGLTEESSSPRLASSEFLVGDTTRSDDDYEGAESDEDDVMSKRTQRSSSIESNKKRKVNNSTPAQGSKASRPIGMTKAKKLAKLEAERSRRRNWLLSSRQMRL